MLNVKRYITSYFAKWAKTENKHNTEKKKSPCFHRQNDTKSWDWSLMFDPYKRAETYRIKMLLYVRHTRRWRCNFETPDQNVHTRNQNVWALPQFQWSWLVVRIGWIYSFEIRKRTFSSSKNCTVIYSRWNISPDKFGKMVIGPSDEPISFAHLPVTHGGSMKPEPDWVIKMPWTKQLPPGDYQRQPNRGLGTNPMGGPSLSLSLTQSLSRYAKLHKMVMWTVSQMQSYTSTFRFVLSE